MSCINTTLNNAIMSIFLIYYAIFKKKIQYIYILTPNLIKNFSIGLHFSMSLLDCKLYNKNN